MKTQKAIYWTTTGLVASGMLMSAWMYLSKNPELVQAFQTLGFPIYFMMILGSAKFLGAIALVAPVGDRVKEWAYAGFMFTFVGATWTHIATGTSWLMPVVFLALLASSYVLWTRLKTVRETTSKSVGSVQHA